MSHLPTPSALERVFACVTSELLPRVDEGSNRYSDFGQAMHRLFQRCIEVGEEQALDEAPPAAREAFEKLDRSKLPPLDAKHYAAEVSYGLSLTTGTVRELGRGLTREQRNAMARPGEMVMTTDLEGVLPDASVIIDVKTGRTAMQPAESNPQVLSYALAAARLRGKSRAKVALLHVLDDGTAWTDVAVLDALDLDAHEARLREMAATLELLRAAPPSAWPVPVIGSHCRYCPARRACPAQRDMLVALARGDNLASGALTDEQLVRAWLALKAARSTLELAESIVETQLSERPVYLGDERWLGGRDVPVQTIVPARAKSALLAEFGHDVATAVVGEAVKGEEKLTQEALAAALKKHAVPRSEEKKLAPVKRRAMEALAKGGAISVRMQHRVGEFKGEEPPMESAFVDGESKRIEDSAGPASALPQQP